MTPQRLIPLVARALGRPGNQHELADWAAVLTRISDDDGEQALLIHRASSPHAPTPADVRKAAVVIANDRALRAEADRLRHERDTHTTLDGRPLLPMPPVVREGLRELQRRQAARDAALADDAAATP